MAKWHNSHWASNHHRFRDPDTFTQTVNTAVAHLRGMQPGYLLACGFGGIPIAAVVAERLHWPLVLVRKEDECMPRAYSEAVLVGTARDDTKRAYVIEDCVSSGKTMTWIINAYENTHKRPIDGAYMTGAERFYTRDDLLDLSYFIMNGVKSWPAEHGPTSTSSTGETASSAPLGF
jgi:adenine/guanine phosphoribosyltransferase-like PRPP-binding protein